MLQANSFFSPKQVFVQLNAAGIKISRSKFYTMLAKGAIPSIRLPGSAKRYLNREQLEKFIATLVEEADIRPASKELIHGA